LYNILHKIKINLQVLFLVRIIVCKQLLKLNVPNNAVIAANVRNLPKNIAFAGMMQLPKVK